MTSPADAAKAWAELEPQLRAAGMGKPRDQAACIRAVGSILPDELEPDCSEPIQPPPPGLTIDRTPVTWWKNRTTEPDQRLAQLLEQACSRRMGYQGDDSV